MEVYWQKWTKDNLPDVEQKVLLVYKSGFCGSIEFFGSDLSKQMYIEGMTEIEKYPDYFNDNDQITNWMPFPDLPSSSYRWDGNQAL
jgi:hypothetical protein